MNDEQKLTGWYTWEKKPVRIGVYATRPRKEQHAFPPRGAFQHWNGSWWGGYGCDVKTAKQNEIFASEWQRVEWRGLASKP